MRVPRGPRRIRGTRGTKGPRGRGGDGDYGQIPDYDGYYSRAYQTYDDSKDYSYRNTTDNYENTYEDNYENNDGNTEKNDLTNFYPTVANTEGSSFCYGHPNTLSYSATHSTSAISKRSSNGSAIPIQRPKFKPSASFGRYPEPNPVRAPPGGSKSEFQASCRNDRGDLYLKRSGRENDYDKRSFSFAENHKRKIIGTDKPAKYELLDVKNMSVDNITNPAKITDTLSFKNPASTSSSLPPRFVPTGEKLDNISHDRHKTTSRIPKQIEISFKSHRQESPKRRSVSPRREVTLTDNIDLENGFGSLVRPKISSGNLSPSRLPSPDSSSQHRQEDTISFRGREKQKQQLPISKDNEQVLSMKGQKPNTSIEKVVVKPVSPNLKLDNDQNVLNNAKQQSVNVPDESKKSKSKGLLSSTIKNLSSTSPAGKSALNEVNMKGVNFDSDLKSAITNTDSSEHITEAAGKEPPSSKQSSYSSVKEQHFTEKKPVSIPAKQFEKIKIISLSKTVHTDDSKTSLSSSRDPSRAELSEQNMKEEDCNDAESSNMTDLMSEKESTGSHQYIEQIREASTPVNRKRTLGAVEKTGENPLFTKKGRHITISKESHELRSTSDVGEPINISENHGSKSEPEIEEISGNFFVDRENQKPKNGIIAFTASYPAKQIKESRSGDISASSNTKQTREEASSSVLLKENDSLPGQINKEAVIKTKVTENQPTGGTTFVEKSRDLPENILSFLGINDSHGYSSYKTDLSVIESFSLLQSENIPSSQANLNIFDFDHTMTSTLTPNPELYTDTTHSYLLASDGNCLSWYDDVLPSLELQPEVLSGGIAPSQCKSQYCVALEDASAGHEFEKEESLESFKTLNYQWSKTLLYMVKNFCESQVASNVLIIGRYVKNISRLKADLDLLNKIGIKFHYVLYKPSKSHPNKYKYLTLSLLEEIHNARFPWSMLTKSVTIFHPFPENLDRSKLSKKRFLTTPALDIRVVYTAKRCSYVKEPSTEVKHIYAAALNDKRYRLTMSISGAVFRLAYSSASSLINYLDSMNFLPAESARSEYLFNFTDIFITHNKLPGKAVQDLDKALLYDGAILQYGQAGKSLYALQFLISTQNTTWEYGAPIMIVARDKSISIAAAKKILKKMDWTYSDSSLNLKFTFFPSSKLKITQS